MSDKDFQIPKSLIESLKAGQVVPFVGAGVSIAVKKKNEDGTKSEDSLFPSWKGFVEILAATLKDEHKPEEAAYVLSSVNIKKPKYLEAMQHAQEELGEGLWYQIFDENFDKSKNEAHEDSLKLSELIWKLSNNLVITANVDRVFQWTCPNPSEFKPLDVQNVEYAQLQKEQVPKRPTVWYLHGSVDHKEKVIFTFDQYRKFYEEKNNEAKLQTLIALLTQRTFLFIGFSLDDAYIREQLEYINKIYKGGADYFYILLRASEIEKANLPNYVKPIPFSDFGKPLEDLIEELNRIANGDDSSGNLIPSTPPDSPTLNPVLQITTSSTFFGTTSSTQKLFKSALGAKHFNVPFGSKGDAFVGREGLREKIWESLNKSGRAAISQAVSIEGFGGLGKTQLAVEYAHEYRDKYEHGVFWLTADEDIDIQLIKIGEDLNWISQFDKDFDQAELVRNRFRKLSDCLIIFDNVDKQEAIKNHLPEIDYHPHILVTSREVQYGFQAIYLDTLSRDEAHALLTQIADRSPRPGAEEKALENILQELDGLPLAVELVGGYLLRRKNISFQDYYEYLDKESIERIEERFPNNPFTKRDKSIIRALTISERLLNETEYLEDILDILAWSGKSSMGYSLLRELVGTNDNLALKNALGVALELHFIKQEENEERYAIHRLLARVRQFEKPLQERKEWHQKIVKFLENWFINKDDESKNLSEAELELDHLETWQRRTLEYLPAEAVWLTLLKANPLIERGSYKEAQKHTEEAIELYEKENLTDKLLLANLYNSLSRPKSYLGNYKEAQSLIERALTVYNENFIDDKKLLVNLLANLGFTYGELGNHQKALELKQQAFGMEQELFDEKHSYIANSLSSLGLTYDKLGNHQKALELKQQAFEMQRELFGEKHPSIASSLNNLGSTYGELGNHQKALELKQQAFEMLRELFGEKHPSIASSLNNLGSTYGELGNHQKAVEYCGKALQMLRETLGNLHPNTIQVCKNLILELLNIGNREKAGRLAGEFLSYVPQNNPHRQFFEKYGTIYQKALRRKKSRRH